MLDRCGVCGMPIGPGQESRECLYCDRIGHQECGAYLTDGGPDDWCCDVCWDDIAVDGEECLLEEPLKLIERPCPRCGGMGYHYGFGEHGHDPDWCEFCGGQGVVFEEEGA